MNGNGKHSSLLPHKTITDILYIKQAHSLLGKVIQGYQGSMMLLDLIDGVISFTNNFYGAFSGAAVQLTSLN